MPRARPCKRSNRAFERNASRRSRTIATRFRRWQARSSTAAGSMKRWRPRGASSRWNRPPPAAYATAAKSISSAASSTAPSRCSSRLRAHAVDAISSACSPTVASRVRVDEVARSVGARCARDRTERRPGQSVLAAVRADHRRDSSSHTPAAGPKRASKTATQTRASAPKTRNARLRIGYLSSDFHEHAAAYLMWKCSSCTTATASKYSPIPTGPTTAAHARSAARRVRAFRRHRMGARRPRSASASAATRSTCSSISRDTRGRPADRHGAAAVRRADHVARLSRAPRRRFHRLSDRRRLHHSAGRGATLSRNACAPAALLSAERPQARLAQSRWAAREYGLPEDGFVFCCFNQTFKITPEVFDVLDAAAAQASREACSGCWKQRAGEAQPGRSRGRAGCRSRAVGVRAAPALCAASRALSRSRSRARYVSVHVAHDGKRRVVVRVSAGRIVRRNFRRARLRKPATTAGLPDLVTHNFGEYEELALRLATDPHSLARVRARVVRRPRSCSAFRLRRIRPRSRSAL